MALPIVTKRYDIEKNELYQKLTTKYENKMGRTLRDREMWYR